MTVFAMLILIMVHGQVKEEQSAGDQSNYLPVNQYKLTGDIKMDFFQLLLGRIGGSIELYANSGRQGTILSLNYYPHLLYNSFNNLVSNQSGSTAGVEYTFHDSILYTDESDYSDQEYRSWNIGFEYRFYRASEREKGRLLFLAPYVRFQQTRLTYQNTRTVTYEGGGSISAAFEEFAESNSYSYEVLSTTEAVALGLTVGRRKLLNANVSFEWYFGVGYYFLVFGNEDLLNIESIPMSFRNGLVFSFGY